MRGMLFTILTMVFWALPALTHPHVFIEAGLRFIANPAGQLSGVEVTWTYDSFHTLLLLEERGLDADGDGVLTAGERAELIGFDLVDLPVWFEGGLFVQAGQEKIALGPPQALSLDMRDGQLVTRHARSMEAVNPAGLRVQAYDPSYFAAITLGDDIALPEGCVPRVEKVDPDTNMEQMAALLDSVGALGVEDTTLGVNFAETLVIECTAS